MSAEMVKACVKCICSKGTLGYARRLGRAEVPREGIWIVGGRCGLDASLPPGEFLEEEGAIKEPIQGPEPPEG